MDILDIIYWLCEHGFHNVEERYFFKRLYYRVYERTDDYFSYRVRINDMIVFEIYSKERGKKLLSLEFTREADTPEVVGFLARLIEQGKTA